MRKDITKYTQNLVGFQVADEKLLLSDTLEVSDLSKLARLPIRRLRKATINIWIERTQFRCPHCGSKEVSTYFERNRMVRGVANANIPVVVHFSAHRIYCHGCGKRSYEEFGFLPSPKSHVTRQLARTIMALRSEMSIKAISDYFDIPWDVVKNIEKSQLARDYAKVPLSKVTALGIDEICVFHHAKSDEKYVTVVRNLETGDVLYVGDGKGVKALEGFAKRIRRWRRHIRYVCMDMANAYAKWVGECLPGAEIVFDHFHVIKAMNDRLDRIRRRTMSKADDELKKHIKGSRYLLTGNAEDLTPDGRARLAEMRAAFSELSDAHGLKEQLRGIYEVARYEFGARLLLEDWCATARATEVPELMSMADTVDRHLDGILGYWKYGRASNAKTEGFNNKIRWLIRQAYGFRDREYFKLKIYALPDAEITKSL